MSGGAVNVGASTRLAEHGLDSLVIDFSGVVSIFPLGLPNVTLVVNGQPLPCTSPVINGPTQITRSQDPATAEEDADWVVW